MQRLAAHAAARNAAPWREADRAREFALLAALFSKDEAAIGAAVGFGDLRDLGPLK